MDNHKKAIFCLLKFADQPTAAIGVARDLVSDLGDPDFRSLCIAIGAFSKDNESYYLRCWGQEHDDRETHELRKELDNLEEQIDKGCNVTHIVFRRPNEPRMKAAYEVLAGWVLKFLYQEKNFVPIEYSDGQGLLWHDNGPSWTPEALWNEYLEWMPEDVAAANVGTLLEVVGGRLGTQRIPKPFMRTLGNTIARAATMIPERFQNHVSFNEGRRLHDLVDMLSLDDDLAKHDDDGLVKELRKQRLRPDNDDKPGDLSKAVACARRVRVAKHVVENCFAGQPFDGEAFRTKCECYRLSKPKSRQLLEDLEALGIAQTCESDGQCTQYTLTRPSDETVFVGLAYVQSLRVETQPPFSLQIQETVSNAGKHCLSCGAANVMPKSATKLILPEAKKVWYDRPRTNDAGDLCAECFYSALISGFYPSSEYAVCEVPLNSSFQTFVLAQRMSNVTAALGAMAIARAPLMTVFPSKYFLVCLYRRKGSLPAKSQLYLLLADYAHCFDVPSVKVYLQEAVAVNAMTIHTHVLCLLSLFKRGRVLPYHSTAQGGTRANDCIRLLETGRPYAALYRLVFELHKDKGRLSDRDIFKSPCTFAAYDDVIQRHGRELLDSLWRGGEIGMLRDNPSEFYTDVKTLSDKLYELLRPIAQQEVNVGGSNVSVIVRKYTAAVEERFPLLSLSQLQYLTAKAADDAEKQRVSASSGGVLSKVNLQSKLDQIESTVEDMYGKYADKGSFYLWEEFVKEVAQRLLARLLLGVRASKNGGTGSE